MKFEMKKSSIKKGSIIRNIFGVLFAFAGVNSMFSGDFASGIFMTLFGISLLPIFYEKTKLNKKHIQIILPIILMLGLGVVEQKSTIETNNNININENNTNMVQEEKNDDITNLRFSESNIEVDIHDNKEVILEVLPENANIENLEFCTSDNQIAIMERTGTVNNENKITLKIKPIGEGSCEIYAKTIEGIESNKITVKIVDNEKAEKERKEAEEQAKKEEEEQAKKQAEEQAKKEAEEQAKKQAEEQAKKEAEEQAKKQAEEQAKKEAEEEAKKQTQSTNKSSSKTTSSSSKSNSNNTHGKSVYRTPSGKRYHFDPDCGGKNSYQTTLDSAKAAGLTPCKKCAK